MDDFENTQAGGMVPKMNEMKSAQETAGMNSFAPEQSVDDFGYISYDSYKDPSFKPCDSNSRIVSASDASEISETIDCIEYPALKITPTISG